MRFLPLLGRRLKDDEIADLLEGDDVKVIYDFDRLHENSEDRYWAEAREQGYQLRFDARQVLDVIFLYMQPLEGFTPIDPASVEDTRFFTRAEEVETYGNANQLRVTRGTPTPTRRWVKFEMDGRSIHYEFRDGQLALVTLSLLAKA